MRGRHSDTVDPVRNTTALGTDIAQDSPEATAPKTTAIARTTTNCGISDAFLSNNINSLLSPRTLGGGFEKWAGTPPSRSDRGLETAANRHPGEGFQDAVNKRVKQQDNNWPKEKGIAIR